MAPTSPKPRKSDESKPSRSSKSSSTDANESRKSEPSPLDKKATTSSTSPSRQRSNSGTSKPDLDDKDSSKSSKSQRPTEPTMPGLKRVETVEKKDATNSITSKCHKCHSKTFKDDKCSKCSHSFCEKCRKLSKAAEAKAQDEPKKRHSFQESERPAAYQSTRSETIAKAASSLRKRSSIGLIKVSSTPRVCHHCDAKFSPYDGMCRNCHHVMCSKCPQDGPSTADDESSKKSLRDRLQNMPRQRVRYTCDQCNTLFEEQSKNCAECGHKLCRRCFREPPKRICHPESSRTKHGREAPASTEAIPVTTGKSQEDVEPAAETEKIVREAVPTA